MIGGFLGKAIGEAMVLSDNTPGLWTARTSTSETWTNQASTAESWADQTSSSETWTRVSPL